ncbi:MAG: NUDIX hydrolase [Clostridia bacterium]|nr:NUDIX hydrolase [Clostridia bacterium]
MDFYEKIMSTDDIFKGKVIDVKYHTVELPDGRISKREVVMHNGGVGVIAVDKDRNVFMVTQYRIAAGSQMLEIPAGKLEEGEDPYAAAIRELQEETGYLAKSLIPLGEYYATPGYCSEKLTIYLATDLEFKGQHLDDGEFLNVEKYPLDDLYDMVMDNKIYDCKTAIAILKAKSLLDK